MANGDTCTWFAFGQSILEFSGIGRGEHPPHLVEGVEPPAIRPPYSGLSCQKLKQVTGMTLRPWSEAVREYLRSLRGDMCPSRKVR